MWTRTAHGDVAQRYAGDEGDKFYVEKVQDVEPILERNKALQNESDGFNHARDGRRVASIPMIVHLQWLKEGFDCTDPNNESELRRRLSSSEYMWLRTSPGAV